MAAVIDQTEGHAAAGFADPVHEPQAIFRAVLGAMSRPGTAQALTAPSVPPAPLAPIGAAVALTLFDQDVTVWLSPSLAVDAVRDYLRFHTGTRIVEAPATATFILCASPGEIPPFDSLAQGTPAYPDRSATIIVDVSDAAVTGDRALLSGPGIEHPLMLALPGFDRRLWMELQANHRAYPLGVDLVICMDRAVIGLPRSTKIEVA